MKRKDERSREYRTGGGSHPDRSGGSGALTGSAPGHTKLRKGGSMKLDRNLETRAENTTSPTSLVVTIGAIRVPVPSAEKLSHAEMRRCCGIKVWGFV